MMCGAKSSRIAQLTYQQTVLADAPVHYWRLQETSGSYAADSGTSPTSLKIMAPSTGEIVNGGTVLNQEGLIPGEASMYMYYNGAETGLRTESELGCEETGEISFELIFKAWSLSNAPLMKEGGQNHGMALGFNSSRLWFGKRIGGTGTFYGAGTGAVATGTVYHAVGTWSTSQSKLRLYLNGSQATGKDGITSSNPASTCYFAVGSSICTSYGAADPLTMNTSSILHFNGFVSNVAIYDYALTSAQALAHYQAAGI